MTDSVTAKKKVKRAMKVWVGFSDGKPHVFRLDPRNPDLCVCSTRKLARDMYEDVRRCYLVIPPKARK